MASLSESKSAAQPRVSFLYLYGIVPAGSPAHGLLEAGRVPGLDPAEPLFAVVLGELVAAVSAVPAEHFEEAALNELVADLGRLAPLAVRHEEAIRALLEAGPTIVPMSFGTVYRSQESLAAALRARGSAFGTLLERLAGRQEWGLKIFVDPAELQAHAEANSPALQEAQHEIAASSPGRAFLLKKQYEKLRAAEVDCYAADRVDQLLQALAGGSEAMRPDTIVVDPREPHPLIGKASFLVAEGQASAFRELGARLAAEEAAQGFDLQWSGPWAPYAFVREADGAE